jgi:hypothetical protein
VRADPVTNLGWWSRRLESREPAWVLGCRVDATAPVVLATLLDHSPCDSSATGLRVGRVGNIIRVKWSATGSSRLVEIDIERDGAVVWRSLAG